MPLADGGAGRLAQITQDLAQLERELSAQLVQTTGRARGALIQRLHHLRRMRSDSFAYGSQAGQDAVADLLLQQKEHGVFVEVGAYDGLRGSNSLFFERMRGWTGLLVEPVPALCAQARAVRQAPCVQVAIGPVPTEAVLIEVAQGYRQMSGLEAHYDPDLLAQVRAHPDHHETRHTLHVRPLAHVLQEFGMQRVDFLSLDIEGAEVAVLERFPFEQFDIRLWSIENNLGTPQLAQIMGAAGYDLVEHCGADEVYLRH